MTSRHAHPIVFMFLILPFGAMGGYLTVTVAYQLAHAGLSVEKIAGLVALSYLPHTWKFAWAPIADTTLSRKKWYLIAALTSGAGIWATGAMPTTAAGLAALSVVVLVSNLAVTFLGMSVESLMAYGTEPHQKGRAGGWFQAGNLGGNGLGGGAGLWLAQRLPGAWMAGAILGVACLLCCLGLLFVPEPTATHRTESLRRTLINVARDLWSVATARVGFLALILCFLPLGSGAASNLWSAVASDWHASANTVATVTGILGGVVSAIGCVLGGWFCDRMNRQWAYAIYGVLQALCAIAMALAPRTESTYVVFTLAYALITGLTYAGFSAFVLEAMGTGAAATKYSVFASLSNTPIAYMTSIDGWAHTRYGPAGMLYTEALFGFLGLALFVVVVAGVRRLWREAPAPAIQTAIE
jgi:MFS transporter, PAT family, beta-lactamase induction signal transducer AmpG